MISPLGQVVSSGPAARAVSVPGEGDVELGGPDESLVHAQRTLPAGALHHKYRHLRGSNREIKAVLTCCGDS